MYGASVSENFSRINGRFVVRSSTVVFHGLDNVVETPDAGTIVVWAPGSSKSEAIEYFAPWLISIPPTVLPVAAFPEALLFCWLELPDDFDPEEPLDDEEFPLDVFEPLLL